MARRTQTVRDLFDKDEVRSVLHDTFYRREPADGAGASSPRRRAAKDKPKPDHYEIICISLYKEDLQRLDAKVEELKSLGHRRMNRSALIRYALDSVDVKSIPRGY